MRTTRFAWIAPLLLSLARPLRASAQAAGGDVSKSAPAASDWGGAVAVVVGVLVLLIAIGSAVKLYDHKRKREDDAMALQSRISDALLREYATLSITAVVTGSQWRRSPMVVAIRGTVSTPELREAVMRLAAQELAREHRDARLEDRLFIDPQMGRHVA